MSAAEAEGQRQTLPSLPSEGQPSYLEEFKEHVVEVGGDVDHVNGLGGIGSCGNPDQGRESHSKVTFHSLIYSGTLRLLSLPSKPSLSLHSCTQPRWLSGCAPSELPQLITLGKPNFNPASSFQLHGRPGSGYQL